MPDVLTADLILAGEEDAQEDSDDSSLFPVPENIPTRLVDLDALVRQSSRVQPLSPVPHPDLMPSEHANWDTYRLMVLRLIVGRKTDKQIQEQCELGGLPIPDSDTLRAYRLDKRITGWMDFDEVAAARQGFADYLVRLNSLSERAAQLQRLVELLDPLFEPTKRTIKEAELLTAFFARKQKESEAEETVKRVGRPPKTAGGDAYIEYSRLLNETLRQIDDMQNRRGVRKLAELQAKDQRATQHAAQKAIEGGRGAIVILPASDPDPFSDEIDRLEDKT